MKNILYSVLIVGLFIVYLVVGQRTAEKQYEATEVQNQIAREQRGYLRVMACELAVPASQRTVEHIENCYNKVENADNIKLERY